MNDPTPPFSFSQFVPGFDFLKNLAAGAADPRAADTAGLSNWVAPTLSVEEVDKRIKELRTVQFWLEQNLHALKATVQALEVQKMTLSTLQGMNLRMEDLAKAFAPPAAEAAAPISEAQPKPDSEPKAEAEAEAGPEGAKGVVDPLQWWGALSQQFQQIASTALQDAASLKMPDAMPKAPARAKAKANGDTAAPRTKTASPRASGARAAARKTSTGRRPRPT